MLNIHKCKFNLSFFRLSLAGKAENMKSFPGSNDMRDANFVGGLGGAACVAEQII